MTPEERAELLKHTDTLAGLRSLIGTINSEKWTQKWDTAYAEAKACASGILERAQVAAAARARARAR